MVEADFEPPVEVAVGDTVTLSFNVEDQGDVVEAFGYSLSGGFGAISARVFEGRVSLDWFAPEELEGSESTRVWVVFQGEEGGTAVWSADWMVGE